MNKRKHALGVLTCNRWEFTKETLHSIVSSSQDPATYDLIIIDNGSTPTNKIMLEDWVENHSCTLFSIKKPLPIPVAWNLFLVYTLPYEFRTMMDNDVVLLGTGLAKYVEQTDVIAPVHTPAESGANPGAVKNVSIIRGPGSIKRKIVSSSSLPSDSNFLDKAREFMVKYKTALMSFVPVPPNFTFNTMLSAFAQDLYKGNPHLQGGCVTMHRTCPEILGYFDERLSRHAILDYSLRAMSAKINIGFHDSYWVVHLGHEASTVPSEINNDLRRESMKIIDNEKPTRGHVGSKWAQIIDPIKNCAQKSKIVNLE